METYCRSLNQTKRFNTREVMIGKVGVGGDNPIRIQSMTTTDTMDTKSTIDQSMRMIDAGCEIVRITAPSIKEARNLEPIKDGLIKNGYIVPIVADIHFTPNAAIVAASIVEKVRINPGNYADRKKFEIHEYTDVSYCDELARIKEKFVPLIDECKRHGTAMRIGTNHGSLSDRILSRYGDTPLGMVESAMEFLRIAEDESYHEIILSMKASNTHVMVQAYRLLVKKMSEEGMQYPLHLGVTEAGEAEDGRIKSSVGIGTLLEDGLGDTIRVSLTEEPEKEIPVAKILADRYEKRKIIEDKNLVMNSLPYDPYFHVRRKTYQILNIGSDQVPRVIGDLSSSIEITGNVLVNINGEYILTYTVNDAAENTSSVERRVIVYDDGNPLVGDIANGGVIFWVNPQDNTHGLVAAISCESSDPFFGRLPWRPNLTYADCEYFGPYRLIGNTEIGGGLENTDRIIALNTECDGGVKTNYAAYFARNYGGGGYNDWYLPNITEVELIHNNFSQ